MSLEYVMLTGKIPGGGGAVAWLTLSGWTPAAAEGLFFPPRPDPVTLAPDGSFSVPGLLANDSSDIAAGTYWALTVRGIGGVPSSSWNFFLNFAAGAEQDISGLAMVSAPPPVVPYMPVPAGEAEQGYVPVATGDGQASAWGPGGGSGTVTSVNEIAPVAGNVTLTAAEVGAASTGALTAEATTRASADTALGTAITSETARAEAAEAILAASVAGVTVLVPAPTGSTAADTPAVTAAIASLVSGVNLAGAATLMFRDGTYQVDGNALVIRNLSNFAVRSSGRTVIAQAPNRSGLPNNVTGDIFVIADSTDFTVEGITFDGMRDTVAPVTALTATASSGQPSVTVAAGQGARYLAGQYLALFGGIGSADQAKFDGFNTVGTAPLLVSSITPGGGSGGGDLITFTTNLGNTYSTVSGTLLSDGYGPYGCTGAFLAPYQCGYNASVAGRTGLGSEDQQNGLHLMNCQRFTVSRVTARNVWESPVKLGCGIAPNNATYANSCSDGTVGDCILYHGYDQGVSVWISKRVTVTGCRIDAPGWGGVVLTGSDDCIVADNQVKNVIYFYAGQAGGGVAVEGGAGNLIRGNVITCPVTTTGHGISVQGWYTNGTWGLGGTNTAWPTLGAVLEGGTVAGTSVQVSSTSLVLAGGRYSIFDGYRTEAVTIATIVDGTHVTFSENTRFTHASGAYITPRFSQENTVTGNRVLLTGAASTSRCVFTRGSVRSLITGNVLRNANDVGVDLSANSQFCPPSSNNAGDGSVVAGNVISGCASHGIFAQGVTNVTIDGNQVSGTPDTGSFRGIHMAGVSDSQVTRNTVTDVNGSDAIHLQQGGPLNTFCLRVTLSGNTARRSFGAGITVTGGDSLRIRGNTCGSNFTFGITLLGVSNSDVEGNTCNSNRQGGINLGNNSATGCSGIRVAGNTCREDGSGQNVQSNASITQAAGIIEAGNSNVNLFAFNECDANTSSQLTVIGAGSVQTRNILSGAIQSS